MKLHIEMSEEEARAALSVIGPVVSAMSDSDDSHLARAEFAIDSALLAHESSIPNRLEQLRELIHDECISWGEIAELQSLAEHIEPGDVELLEWAGVPEFPDEAS